MLSILTEKYRARKKNRHMVFIYPEKEFDRLQREIWANFNTRKTKAVNLTARACKIMILLVLCFVQM